MAKEVPLTIENGVVTECGKSALSVEIPASVSRIGGEAFSYDFSLKDIRFGGTVAQWEAVEKGDGWNMDVPATEAHCADGDAAHGSSEARKKSGKIPDGSGSFQFK